MAYEVLDTAPTAHDFTPLSEHQEQTPGTFFGGKPVLHLQCSNAKVRISKAELLSQRDFAALQDESTSNDQDTEVILSDIDVWVSSRHLTLFSNTKSTGIQILYPTITIHAQEGSAVLLELNLSDADTADEDLEFLQLRILPDTVEGGVITTEKLHGQSNGDDSTSASAVRSLYEAISACQELNPDPASDEEGGFDETAPGATGWITSENMADFMDEDGNFRMPEGMTVIGGEEEEEQEGAEASEEAAADGLGAGAGRTRTAAEVDAEDGGEDEAKWQRTG